MKKLASFIFFISLVSSSLMAQTPINIDLWNVAPNDNGLKGEEVKTAPHFIVNISKASMAVYPSSKPGSKAIIMFLLLCTFILPVVMDLAFKTALRLSSNGRLNWKNG